MKDEKKNKRKLHRLLSQMKPPEGTNQKDYKAYSLIKKMDGSYSIKLMFGYSNKKTKDGKRNTNPIYGSSFEFKGYSFLIEVLDVLEYGLKVEKENKLFSGLNDDEEEEQNEEW